MITSNFPKKIQTLLLFVLFLTVGCGHIKSVRTSETAKYFNQAPSFSEQVIKEFSNYEAEKLKKRKAATENVIAATVVLLSPTSGTAMDQGTGFFITPNLIVTNKHVVESACTPPNTFDKLQVLTSDLTKKYTVLAISRSNTDDLAIVHVLENHSNYVSLGGQTEIVIGERISVVGHPRGHLSSLNHGWITSTKLHKIGFAANQSIFQFDASISPGNSGGAVITESGLVIGVVTATNSEPFTQNLNYATSVNQVKILVQQYIEYYNSQVASVAPSTKKE